MEVNTMLLNKKSNTSWKNGYTAALLLALTPFLFFDGCSQDEETLVQVQITYDLNGGTGTTPVDPNTYPPGTKVTILNDAGLTAPPDTAFYGWSTSPDGRGHFFTAFTTFTITKDTTLYALWSGDGTSAAYPKLIGTKEELTTITVNANTALVNDIDNLTAPLPAFYTGTFDGRGHTVTLAIFQNVTEVTPRSFGLFQSITGNAQIKNFHKAGFITLIESGSSNLYVGGIVGSSLSDAASLKNCMSTVQINAVSTSTTFYAGGLVGASTSGGINVEHCYFSGTIETTGASSYSSAKQRAGGIIGNFSAVTAYISQTVSLTNITWSAPSRARIEDKSGARGVVGGLSETPTLSLNNNYAMGTITMTDNIGPVTTQAASPDYDGTTIDPASNVDSETWWRTTAGWEAVWGGDNPTADKPWVWDAAAKRPKLHKI
jgi:hypothetical protein